MIVISTLYVDFYDMSNRIGENNSKIDEGEEFGAWSAEILVSMREPTR